MLRGGYSMNVLTISLYDNGTVSEIGPLMNNQKSGGPAVLEYCSEACHTARRCDGGWELLDCGLKKLEPLSHCSDRKDFLTVTCLAKTGMN